MLALMKLFLEIMIPKAVLNDDIRPRN